MGFCTPVRAGPSHILELPVSKFRLSLVAVLMVSALSGCKDDPLGVNSGDSLTLAEMQAVLSAISSTFSSLGFAPAAVGGPAMTTVSVSESFDVSAPCAEAGSIDMSGSVNGTVDDVTFTLEVDYQLRLTPNGCIVPTEGGTVTLEGSPYIQLDMGFMLSETQIVVSGSETGGIAFTSSDGRSGSCLFDVTFSVSADLEGSGASSSASGTVCGVSASNLTVFEID
jgi:hypothetical protein